MGGPKKGAQAETAKPGGAGKQDIGKQARQAFVNEDYSTAYTLLKDNPDVLDTPAMKGLFNTVKGLMGL
jgi:hypothetical protein